MLTVCNVHTELQFGSDICAHLESNGWSVLTHLKNATSYCREQALFVEDLFGFVQDTQPQKWVKFKSWHNGQSASMFARREENESLAAQAASNTEQQFAMGDFPDIFIEGQEVHNNRNIDNQLLKDDCVFAAMQRMLAKMVYQAFALRGVPR